MTIKLVSNIRFFIGTRVRYYILLSVIRILNVQFVLELNEVAISIPNHYSHLISQVYLTSLFVEIGLVYRDQCSDFKVDKLLISA